MEVLVRIEKESGRLRIAIIQMGGISSFSVEKIFKREDTSDTIRGLF